MAQRDSKSFKSFKNEQETAVKEAVSQPWVRTFTRVGYAVRGLLYALIGLLAIQVAIGGRGEFTDQQGAIQAIGRQPFGKVLLILTIAGLIGYALWGFIRAFLDPLRKGKDLKGLVSRAGFLASGVAYSTLVIPAIREVLDLSSQGGGTEQSQQAVSSILENAWGPWLVGAVGLAILGAGIVQIVQGWKANFDMRFDAYELNPDQRRWANRLGRFGSIARGIVLSISGLFILQAAIFDSSQRVRGIDGALLELSRQPYGTVLLAVVAAGLIAFGAYSILGAAWFRLKNP